MTVVTLELKGVANLFKSSKIDITKHRRALSSIERDIEGSLRAILKVVPYEAVSAIAKIAQGDIKSFAEIHIEPHLCTNLTTLCRDYPYRIKYSISIDCEALSLYSECINLEILLTIVFGDIARYFEFIDGYRDGILFKYSVIPIAVSKLYNAISSLVGFEGVRISSRYLQDLLEDILTLKDEITELILAIPCIDARAVEMVNHMAKEMLKNPFTRIFIVTSPPSMYDAKSCGISYREFFASYIELLDVVEKGYGIYLCDSEVNNFEVIINRATYLTSYDLRPSLKSEFIPVRGYSIIDNFTLKYLRDCLCSSHIVKNRKRIAY